MYQDIFFAQLRDYCPTYKEEIWFCTRMQNLITRYPHQCFNRDLALGHFTASAFIVDQKFNKAVLVHHKKLNRWLQPGGHADGNQNLLQVAIKEANEETGLYDLRLCKGTFFDLDIHLIPANTKEQAHFHYDVRYLFIADENRPLAVSEESHDVQWISFGAIQKTFGYGQSLCRMMEKSLKYFHKLN